LTLRAAKDICQLLADAKTASFYGIHFGEVKHNGSGVSLQGDSFAQFESRVALHNSAFALNDRQIPNVIDILQGPISAFVGTTAIGKNFEDVPLVENLEKLT